MKNLLLAVIILTFSLPTFAQHYDWSLNGQVIKGFILKHNEHVGHLANSHPSGIELSLQQKLNGKREWENLYNKPIVSYGISYYDLKNPKLGHLVVGSAAMDLPLKRTENTALFFRIGTGLVYSTNPYDRETNNQNNMVTSTITYLLQTRLTYEIKLNEEISLTPNLNLTHASNGAQRAPNRGVNIITANMGMSYKIKSQTETETRDIVPLDKTPYQLYLLLSSGRNTRTLQVREPLPFFNLLVFGQKYVNPKSDWGIGIEYFHSYSLKEQIATDWFRINGDAETADFKRLGLLIGHELKFGKLGFITQAGVYVYNPSKSNMPIYLRAGLRYQFHENIMAQVALKTHAATAEQAEIGLGWRF
ncbi:Lipid A 3-O-deacylase (PagL) [Marivirga sericea]|uniref:Lipid A 3-O-deacylase (PagL) n=1 Tax=Marivirga sericea TaxID=1028 RepID=A0A1X7IQ68_9BACT|nr:acyloxyacyl hydrolase [Marivirga sericea]SMG16865.1 Lipid A 3-O-deacylase (PagL) [Marivirga sericea]